MITINVRTDEDVKKSAEKLFESLGFTMSTAVNMFLRQAIRVNGLPFEVKAETPNEITLAAMQETEQILHDPNTPYYSDMDSLKKALSL